MKPIVLIDGCEYCFIEMLPSLGTSVPFILCADTNGNRYICPKDFWICHALEPEPTAPVHANSIDQEKIDFFISMLRGRENLYAKRYHNLKTGKFVPYADQWSFLSTLPKITPESLAEYSAKLCNYGEIGTVFEAPEQKVLPKPLEKR